MKRIFTDVLSCLRSSLLLFGLLAAAACDPMQQTVPQLDGTGGASFNADGTLNVKIRTEIPGMLSAATKSMGGSPDYNSLNLYLLVFEEGEGLRQFAPLTQIPHQDDDRHDHAELMTFQASIEPTEKPAVIHLVASSQDLTEKVRYGTEDLVLASLYTDGGHEAYWQRIKPGCCIPSRDQLSETNELYDPRAEEYIEKIENDLSHVALIRNFCRVSVDASAAMNFELTGLYVVNTVDRGSVAPYVRLGADADEDGRFVEYYYYDEAEGAYAGKSYDDISRQGHIGTLPSGVRLINTGTDPQTIATKSEKTTQSDAVQPVYFYERPARSDAAERTFVILRGNVTIEGQTQKGRFYKLDLGRIDETIPGEGDTPNNSGGPVGLFTYYNLLRNFDYHIILKEVSDTGYASFEDASKGAVYNNFSAAVEARNMKSISDGQDMIFVNHTSFVFTYEGQVDTLLAQYRTDVMNGSGGVERNDSLYFAVDGSGDEVIALVTPDPHHGPDLSYWNKYEVAGTNPTDQLRQQRLYIYRGNRAEPGQPADYGLYRVITYFSHTPWSFEHIDTFPGSWEQMDDMPSWEWSDGMREIGQSKGSPLTLFFELPGGLPQALFPLEFVIEADRQNIQNAYAGNAVVRSVPASESLFADNPTLGSPTPVPPSTPRIQYVKTVSWEDYFGEWSEELLGTGSRVVRCRFLTITDLAQDGIGGSESKSTTTLRVSNPYFDRKENGKWVYHQDGFERDVNTSDPTPGIWDFSATAWVANMEALKGGNSSGYSGTVDDLTIAASKANTLRSGTYNFVETPEGEGAEPVTTTYAYLRTSSSDVSFTHTRAYPGNDKRKIQIRIMATDDTDGKGAQLAAPSVKLTVYNNQTQLTLHQLKSDESTLPYPTLVYETNEIDMRNYNSVTLTVSPSDNTPVRFYRIEFYPRGEDFNASDAGSGGSGG